jgi:LytS/YehU family sensor histidine kinase
MGLSDLLRYMLYECNQPVVPLRKEIKMLEDYITLEQIRYNHQLDISMDLPEDTSDLYIAPLLLLPFVENCFKHGASQLLENPWVSLGISLEGSVMKMKLVNGKTETFRSAKTEGIGIANVRKRLDLIYPDRYTLKISDEPEVFVVTLRLQLEKIAMVKEPVAYQMADAGM